MAWISLLHQLVELLDALGVQTADIVGLSMGGVIASAFTVRHPERVRKLILIDPSGMAALPQHVLYRIAAVPGLGELAFGLAGTGALVQGIASDFFDPRHVAVFRELYRTQMQFRGFKRAVLVNDPEPDARSVYRRLSRTRAH